MARSAWRLEAQNNFILVDTGLLTVATSDKSSLVLLKDAVLEFPVEYPPILRVRMPGTCGTGSQMSWDLNTAWPCPSLLSTYHLRQIAGIG